MYVDECPVMLWAEEADSRQPLYDSSRSFFKAIFTSQQREAIKHHSLSLSLSLSYREYL